MDVKLLIDGIMRQTTVLIAQLSTGAGIRAPLSHVADQVFLDLASEIEAQGVTRKVAADMFGLALRSYQKKVQRLTESASVRDRTLWEAVLDFLTANGSVPRERLFERFRADAAEDVAAVLNDLVAEGIIYTTGRGQSTVYGLSTEADRQRVLQSDREESLDAMIWITLYRKASTLRALSSSLVLEPARVEAAIARLRADGRVRETEGVLSAETFLVPVGSTKGWEAAVFDHFSAASRAIAAKVRRGKLRSAADDEVGGATLTFEVRGGHPFEQEVRRLLSKVRADVNDLWSRVDRYNETCPIPEDEQVRVTFYFGQMVEEGEVNRPEEER
ncbi:MAG: hypothetical protein EOO73_11610 [Myxococcales bacterium]|nr:MAG: hypothetical protein EOO73_11610 [Myxococcales bacterium]